MNRTMPSKSFTPPTLDEVLLHSSKLGLPDREANKFWLFYDGKDWFVGRNKMKRWHSAMALWKMNYQERGGTLTKTVQQAKMPTREAVYEYAKQKGDTKGMAISFYDKWLARNFQQNGMSIDWKIIFSEMFSKQRQ